MNEKNKTRNTVKVIYPKYYKYWIGPAYSCFTNKPKGPKKRVGLDNMWTGFFSQKTISLLFIYLEYQSSTTIKTGGFISILQNLFLFLDIFYQNFPIHFLNSKPVNSEQFGSDQKVHYHQVWLYKFKQSFRIDFYLLWKCT